jgi:TetR/AcrR family fatty acid metabolism transcriptional regulator
VADGTIYLYFKNKDDILVSIFEHSMDYFIQTASAEIAKVSEPEDKLKCFITLHLELVKKNPNLSQVLQVELRSSSKFMRDYKPEKFFDYLNLLEKIIVEGQEKGVFNRDINASMVKRSIFGAIDELALEYVLTKKKRYEIEEAATYLSGLLLNGIRSSSGVHLK